MRIKIYADVLFFVNFGMDYLLLFFTGRLMGKRNSALRTAFAAGVGAAYAVMAFFLSVTAAALPIKAAVSAGMVRLAFGKQSKREFCKSLCGFYLISLACGGIGFAAMAFGGFGSKLGAVFSGGVWYFHLPVYRLLLAAVICYPLFRVVFSAAKRVGEKKSCLCRITVSYREKEQSCSALYDTGNFLEDGKGHGILLAEWSAVAAFFPQTASLAEALRQYSEEFCFVRCVGIGGEKLLPAFCAQIRLKGCSETETRLAAVTEQKLDARNEYQIILPNDLEGAERYDGNVNQKFYYGGKVSIFQKMSRRDGGRRCRFLHQWRRSTSAASYAGGGSHAASRSRHGQSRGKKDARGT